MTVVGGKNQTLKTASNIFQPAKSRHKKIINKQSTFCQVKVQVQTTNYLAKGFLLLQDGASTWLLVVSLYLYSMCEVLKIGRAHV